jgi:hypothetical protein
MDGMHPNGCSRKPSIASVSVLLDHSISRSTNTSWSWTKARTTSKKANRSAANRCSKT